MIYEIEPLDHFFFRDPTPFEAGGETTVLHSVFPPFPSVYGGAFRQLNGQSGVRSLKVGWNGLRIENEFCFPMPEDICIREKNEGGLWNLERKSIIKKTMSNDPLNYRFSIGEKETCKPVKEMIPYIREGVMASYLKGDKDTLTCIDVNEKLSTETKLGIEIDRKSKAAKEHRIYTTLCVRPGEGVKLAVDIHGDLLGERAIIRLGGEGKLVHAEKADCHLDMEAGVGSSRYFKLYLATPAIFRKGWIPGWINEGDFTGYFGFRNRGVKVKLIGACVGRALPWGGFGYVKRSDGRGVEYRPRELRFAVPAGSVYYFELLRGTCESAVKLFHKKCISDYRESLGFDYPIYNKFRYCDRGFGYSLIGRLSREQEDVLHV